MPKFPDTLLGRLSQAIAWFKARVPMTKAEADALDAEARRRAFWVAGTQQLGEVSRIQRSLTKALERGESFDTWRRQAESQFTEVSTGHAETVYRNATQGAYNRGRLEQIRKPAVLRARPYVMYVAIGGSSGDGRTTDLCKRLHGTILPADDPRVDALSPPNHHKCRSTWRSLSERQARALGGVTAIPDVEFPAGFESPTEGEELAAAYPPEMVDILKAKQ